MSLYISRTEKLQNNQLVLKYNTENVNYDDHVTMHLLPIIINNKKKNHFCFCYAFTSVILFVCLFVCLFFVRQEKFFLYVL